MKHCQHNVNKYIALYCSCISILFGGIYEISLVLFNIGESMDLKEVNLHSQELRRLYHKLEIENHGSTWSVEEAALAFLTDAALVGRLTMDKESRWPSNNTELLPMKIGECVWWLAVLAERMDMSFEECVEVFLKQQLDLLKG